MILLEQVVAGMLENGIGATVKHFPCGGAEEMDGHICPADVDISHEEWDRTLGYVYRHLIRTGVPAFMTTHQTFAAAQTPDENGEYEICTISKELTTDLLKNQLGFKGVVVSDALVMGGFAGENSAQKMIDCFTAGTDILLWPPVEYIDELEKRILSGAVPMERLEDALSRIWKLKENLGLFNHQKEEDFNLKFVEDASTRLGQSCITLVNNKSNRIPFDKEKIKKLLIVGITPDDNDFTKFSELVYAFEKRGIEAELRRDIWLDDLTPDIQKQYDLLIFAMCRLPHHPVGCLDMYGNNANSLWTAHTCDTSKMLPVSFGSPFSYKYFFKDDMYINAYSPSSDVMESFVAAILGEIPFKGTSPVKLR